MLSARVQSAYRTRRRFEALLTRQFCRRRCQRPLTSQMTCSATSTCIALEPKVGVGGDLYQRRLKSCPFRKSYPDVSMVQSS
jgi:hypothetical protein